MTAYAYHPNSSVRRVVNSWEALRPRSNDERRAEWAVKYYARGDHRKPTKPRIRIPVPEQAQEVTP